MRAMTRRDALAAGQRADRLVDVVAGELKRAEQIAEHADRLVREVLLHLLPDRQIRVEQLQRLLREVAHLEARAELHARPRPASSAPAIILSSVVLPAPFRPITHQRSPRRTWKDRNRRRSRARRSALRTRSIASDVVARSRRRLEVELARPAAASAARSSRSSRAP